MEATANSEPKDIIPIYIPRVEKGLIDSRNRKTRFLDFLKAKPSKNWFLKFAAVRRLRKNPAQMESSPPDQSPQTRGSSRFRVPFVRKINWEFLIQYFKQWIKHPMNMALMVWLFFVTVGIIAIALLMLGILNGAIPSDSVRKRWTEIFNQIVNALFTIMCLYNHPKIFHHLVILCRWEPKDAVELRMVYCKTSARRRYERAHLGFVIGLLHLTCFAQYVLCALYWGWTDKSRPDWANYLLMGVGIAAPVTAGLYTFYSPLGRKSEFEFESESELVSDEESQKKASLSPGSRVRVVVTEPQWLGGLFDCWDDLTVAYLSFFCTFCVFGWNMERLGFGNMYVHIATFTLLCIAPVLVFGVAATNITNDVLKYAMGISGCVLCLCGFLYGGFWRIQMRKKFKLPSSSFCCGCPSVTDFMSWLFCWSCSLAQEVRTGNFYEIEDESIYMRSLEEEARVVVEPLHREGMEKDEESNDGSGSMKSARDSSVEFSSIDRPDQMMRAPTPPLIQIDEDEKAAGS